MINARAYSTTHMQALNNSSFIIYYTHLMNRVCEVKVIVKMFFTHIIAP